MTLLWLKGFSCLICWSNKWKNELLVWIFGLNSLIDNPFSLILQVKYQEFEIWHRMNIYILISNYYHFLGIYISTYSPASFCMMVQAWILPKYSEGFVIIMLQIHEKLMKWFFLSYLHLRDWYGKGSSIRLKSIQFYRENMNLPNKIIFYYT